MLMSPVQGTFAQAASSAKMGEMKTRVSIVEDDVEARELLAEWLDSTPDFRCASAHADGLIALDSPGTRPPAVR